MIETTRRQNILVIGGEHCDRIAYALQFAMRILCLSPTTDSPCSSCSNCQRVASNVHPNLLILEPLSSGTNDVISKNYLNSDNTGTIKIEQVRRVIVESQKTNFEKGLYIFLITHMHKTTKAAANAMLKIIEENEASKLFIALAPSRMNILPTLASRLICHHVKPKALSTNDDYKTDLVQKISNTTPLARFTVCGEMSDDREEFLKEIEILTKTCHMMLRDNMISPRFALHLSEALHKAKNHLQKNLNPRLVLETLLLCDWPFHLYGQPRQKIEAI
ncbi:MAG TPA: hypothetical protein VEL47_05525 [Myxococcota bacterium]|nr:hypothetical protein [Myxococcota bacterium]